MAKLSRASLRRTPTTSGGLRNVMNRTEAMNAMGVNFQPTDRHSVGQYHTALILDNGFDELIWELRGLRADIQELAKELRGRS